jgi:hypothetical protein
MPAASDPLNRNQRPREIARHALRRRQAPHKPSDDRGAAIPLCATRYGPWRIGSSFDQHSGQAAKALRSFEGFANPQRTPRLREREGSGIASIHRRLSSTQKGSDYLLLRGRAILKWRICASAVPLHAAEELLSKIIPRSGVRIWRSPGGSHRSTPGLHPAAPGARPAGGGRRLGSRTPTGVRIWYGRQPGWLAIRSHTPGYHPRTAVRRAQEPPEGWQEISAPRTPPGCLAKSPPHTPRATIPPAQPPALQECQPGGLAG